MCASVILHLITLVLFCGQYSLMHHLGSSWHSVAVSTSSLLKTVRFISRQLSASSHHRLQLRVCKIKCTASESEERQTEEKLWTQYIQIGFIALHETGAGILLSSLCHCWPIIKEELCVLLYNTFFQ